jgi:8-oxo-dGTP pyrophosphatase MutT (NUDIX family)
MDFEKLVVDLEDRLSRPLPGALAHEPLRAIPLGPSVPLFEHSLSPKPGGVLILLYPLNDQVCFPLTRRADYVGAHSGQISLPGGKTEPGEDGVQTALRECAEEIGVGAEKIKVIGKLTDFFVIPSNFLVTPVVGVCPLKPAFIADHKEVVKIIEGNLDELIRDDAVKQKEILAAGRFPMLAPHFEIEGEVVWGATAMMLNEFRLIVIGLMMSC